MLRENMMGIKISSTPEEDLLEFIFHSSEISMIRTDIRILKEAMDIKLEEQELTGWVP